MCVTYMYNVKTILTSDVVLFYGSFVNTQHALSFAHVPICALVDFYLLPRLLQAVTGWGRCCTISSMMTEAQGRGRVRDIFIVFY